MRIVASVITIFSTLVVALASGAPAGASELYTVVRHDTLYSIARHFSVTVADLARANNLPNTSDIHVGEVLVIPDPGALRPIVFAPTAPPSSTPVSGESDSLVPKTLIWPQPAGAAQVYVVQVGDTLYHIAVTHGVTVAALENANHLGISTTLHIGQALVIPGTAASAPPPVADAQSSRPFGPALGDTLAPAAGVDTPVTLVPPDSGSAGPPVVRGSLQSSLVTRHVTAEALQYLGTPYAWGGTTRAGVDCSGLVWAIYSPYVPDLPRVSYDQWGFGTPVDMTALEPGDLVFFNTDGTGASHVGIYIGDGRFVHPSAASARVVVDELDEPYFLSHYLGARRVL